jgi:hypothetical protein
MAVSETVLTNCIGELRKVLGETVQAPRFIQTVHRRGYRFLGQFPSAPQSAPQPAAAVPPSPPMPAPLLAVLEHQAPTWLAQMPALCSAPALEAMQRRAMGATPERMVRELAEAVELLTATRPLLLLLEDLHWSDYATLDLVAYLARRPGPTRLLLLGTYRPVEVLLRGHPLQTVKRELVLHGQAVELPLELLTAAAVAQYLALRCASGVDLPPAGRELAQHLYQRTDGHPLFLVTVVEPD